MAPLMGVMALGGEAGSWYVTKQHAQNAADAAAYSGALWVANPEATSSVTYRGKEFAAQSAFCNAGDTTSYPGRLCAASLPTGVSQSVTIDRGTLAGGAWTTSATGSYVRATVGQQQPAYLAKILGLTTVNINAQAIAQVNTSLAHPCALTLTGSLSFQGSPNIIGSCPLASNDPASDGINFTGGGATIPPSAQLLTAGGCTGSATFCNRTNTFTFRPPVTNPFKALDGALTTLCGANPTLPATCGLSTSSKTCPMFTAYTAATPCTNNNSKTKGNTPYPLAAGVYFISGTLTMVGGSSITGTGVTLILLPGASIDTKGGGTITITAPTTAPSTSSLPPSLQSDASLFDGMAIYDASATDVTFGGTSNINLTGNIYAPTAAVTFQGDPRLTFAGGLTCGELIAKSIALNGNATFDDSGCPTATVPNAQVVLLVQ
jgi:hypothetical protein